MVLQEIGVVLACDCPMVGHGMCEDDAGIVVGENDHNRSIAGILPHLGFAGWPVMAPLFRLPFHFRLISSRPRLIQRYDMMQECIFFLFVTFQMHQSRLVSLPFLDFSQTVRDRMRCLQQCCHWTNLGFFCTGSSGPWLICRILPSSTECLNHLATVLYGNAAISQNSISLQ